MILLGIGLCLIAAIFGIIALVGLRTEERSKESPSLAVAPSLVLVVLLPFFLLRRVIREWPQLSIYSILVLASVAATIAAVVVLAPDL